MRKRTLLVCTASLLLSLGPGWSQEPAPPPAPSPAPPQDTYGRQTPRKAFLAFLGAAERGKYGTASEYLQFPPKVQPERKKLLARQLRDLLDSGFTVAGDVSDRPEGSHGDDLQANEEKIGVIQTQSGEIDVVLTRIVDKEAGSIWVFPAVLVSRIPDLHREVGLANFEETLPDAIVENQVLGVALWKWFLAVILAPAIISVIYLALYFGQPVLRLAGYDPGPQLPRAAFGPISWIVVIVTVWIVLKRIGLPILIRYAFARILGVAAVVVCLWLALLVIDRLVDSARRRTTLRDHTFVVSMSGLARQVSKTLLVIVAFLIALHILGFDVKTAMAGVGIGGIAIALGAQKTFENLIGGVSILTDRVMNVGDICRVGDQSGKVESISLRSTKLRTADGSLLAVPNGLMASVNVENLSNRTGYLFNPVIPLRYETTVKQLLDLLDRIREVLKAHPHIDPDGLQVRLKDFGAASLDVEVSAQVRTADHSEYLAIREQLLVEIMNAVEAVGSRLHSGAA